MKTSSKADGPIGHMSSQWLELEVDKISGDPEKRGCNLGNLNSLSFAQKQTMVCHQQR